MFQNVLAIQALQDPERRRQILSGKSVFVDSDLMEDANKADEEMSAEEFRALQQSQKETEELDAELEKIFGASAL